MAGVFLRRNVIARVPHANKAPVEGSGTLASTRMLSKVTWTMSLLFVVLEVNLIARFPPTRGSPAGRVVKLVERSTKPPLGMDAPVVEVDAATVPLTSKAIDTISGLKNRSLPTATVSE